jgi:hypothetical protein
MIAAVIMSMIVGASSMFALLSPTGEVAGACMNNSDVETVVEDRLAVVQARSAGEDPILDTLQLSGMVVTQVTNDSICVLARAAYLDILHSADSATRAAAAAAFPEVLVYQLTPNRRLIATDEADGYRFYRRVLVDSNWVFISEYL